jgi:hypothetical protein
MGIATGAGGLRGRRRKAKRILGGITPYFSIVENSIRHLEIGRLIPNERGRIMLVFNWITVGAFLLLCGTALYLSSWVWKSALRQRRRLRWPRVTGKVVEQRMREGGAGIHLEYLVAYEVDGQPMQRVARDWSPGAYTGPEERHGLGEFEKLMRKRLEAFPQGGDIELLVHPEDPGRVFYRRGLTWPLVPLAIMVTLAFAALVAVLAPVIFVAPTLPDEATTKRQAPPAPMESSR